jgi:hypothetical protein
MERVSRGRVYAIGITHSAVSCRGEFIMALTGL